MNDAADQPPKRTSAEPIFREISKEELDDLRADLLRAGLSGQAATMRSMRRIADRKAHRLSDEKLQCILENHEKWLAASSGTPVVAMLLEHKTRRDPLRANLSWPTCAGRTPSSRRRN
jgi:hypothetical protein